MEKELRAWRRRPRRNQQRQRQNQVEPSTGNTVEVVAQKTAKAATIAAAKEALEKIEIREEVSSSSISISTKLPRGGGWFDGGTQVKYTVRVPAGAEVKFTTVNGGVDVTGLRDA